jgi:hypothetical protein
MGLAGSKVSGLGAAVEELDIFATVMPENKSELTTSAALVLAPTQGVAGCRDGLNVAFIALPLVRLPLCSDSRDRRSSCTAGTDGTDGIFDDSGSDLEQDWLPSIVATLILSAFIVFAACIRTDAFVSVVSAVRSSACSTHH